MEFFNSFIHALVVAIVGLGMWVTLTLGTLSSNIVVVKNNLSVPNTNTPTATSTAAATNTTTTTPKKVVALPVTKKDPTPVPQTPPPAAQAPIVITDDIISQANASARAALVNILCTFRTANTSSYISGSGVIVDPRGVILTNAHVAQFFLLQNYISPGSTSCVIRAGSPAVAQYQATLLYLPPKWIATNASQIISQQATGTGERDYAFLYITGPSQFGPALPSSSPALNISIANPKQGDPVLLAGYPAGFLDGNEIQRNLYVSSAVSKIGQLYTFDSATHVDVVSLGGTVVSQSGSSGGAVINLATGNLAGLIATESEGTTTASRDLRAITMSHINSSLQEDGKGSIVSLLSGDLAAIAKEFNTDAAPALTKQLVDAIEGRK